MKKLISIIFALMLMASAVCAEEAKQNRGLFAFTNGSNVQVSWRMRATDDPHLTKYKLYSTTTAGVTKLVDVYTDKTTVQLSATTYGKNKFSIVVLDKDNNEIDRQEGVKVSSVPYIDIPLTAPVIKHPADGSNLITYTPSDCSAYDMDGDGEQEIILKWEPSALTTTVNGNNISGNEFYDCYKLDGTRLFRIDMGQNCNAGNNCAFYCWDFDGDGKGEMVVKSAPGTKDNDGNYVGSAKHSATGKDLPGYATDLNTTYYRGSDGLPTRGEEWLTIFSYEGKELASRQYWPYFSIQTNWYPGGNDGEGYGRRGCSQKGAVMKIPCLDGQTRPCAFFQRGAYTYVYGICVSWDGKNFVEEWRHASTAASGNNCSWTERGGQKTYQNISLYAQGAHPTVAADLDGDGYDECCIGAATIDHDGTVLWTTKLGHGDAVHVGDLDPTRPGLEVWRITEGATKYDACMIDGATGEVLCGELYTSGDVGRGVAIDIDSTHVGSEYVHNASGYFYDCKGNALYKKSFGSNTGYPNYRIFWDGDLLEEHFSGSCVSKFTIKDGVASNYRCSTPTSGTDLLWKLYATSSINGTKDNPCLQCDLFGDWREELVFYTTGDNVKTAKCDFALRIITTSFNTDKKLPWLRDDNTYNMAIASQNVGYSMPPHLGYNPFVYYDSLRANAPELKFEPVEGHDYYMMSDETHYLDIEAGTNASNYIINSTTPATVQFEYTTTPSAFLIKHNGKYLADNGTLTFKIVETAAEATAYTAVAYPKGIVFQSNGKFFNSATGATISRSSSSKKYFAVIDAGSATLIQGVSGRKTDIQPVMTVTPDGRITNTLVKGLNIIRYSDGTTRKLLVK